MSKAFAHEPVLVEEIVEHLQLKSNDTVFDGTVGGGGHAEAFLNATQPHGMLIGCDLDPRAVHEASKRLQSYGSRVKIVQANYIDIQSVLRQFSVETIDGALVDLGLSSYQLDHSERGFSFSDITMLDMRFNPESTDRTASDIVLHASESELQRIFKEYGEISSAKKIAATIIHRRNRRSFRNPGTIATDEFVDLIYDVLPKKRRIHPATQVFQALRIAVNSELSNIEKFLPEAIEVLCPGGRLAVIAFHSLEDRIVKQYFKQSSSSACICPPEQPVCTCNRKPSIRLVNKKVITATETEIRNNPRARSAVLRVVEKLP